MYMNIGLIYMDSNIFIIPKLVCGQEATVEVDLVRRERRGKKGKYKEGALGRSSEYR